MHLKYLTHDAWRFQTLQLLCFENKQVPQGRSVTPSSYFGRWSPEVIYIPVQQQPVDKRRKTPPVTVRFWSLLRPICGTVFGSLWLHQQFACPAMKLRSTICTRSLLGSFPTRSARKTCEITGTVNSSWPARKRKTCQKEKLNMRW